MDYIRSEENGQLCFEQTFNNLLIPNTLFGFVNTDTTVEKAFSGRMVYAFHGKPDVPEEECICPKCGKRMHVNTHPDISIRHLPFGGSLTAVIFPHNQLRCPHCKATKSQFIAFKAANHLITLELLHYTEDLLATGNYTNKEVAEITGLGKNTVKDIDKARLMALHTEQGKLKKPEGFSDYLGIDEFKLHDGHRFATHITDLKTGHILWIAEGKKKQVVYDFINHVGLEWMSHVKAVACDMNSDFQEAFTEKCPHIQIVFDHFHIVKNFNEKMVSEIRKDEQRRLIAEGNIEAARALKGSKYILTSNRSTLQSKDEEARSGKVAGKGSQLFHKPDYVRKEGQEARYDEILRQNKLLFTCDLIKEKLQHAYTLEDATKMGTAIGDIVYYCFASENEHLEWFGRLLMNHHNGIVSYATHKISTGKMEGINNKIKTLRRQGYGYPDDEYFFLKLIDMSRADYVRNQKSHKICD